MARCCCFITRLLATVLFMHTTAKAARYRFLQALSSLLRLSYYRSTAKAFEEAHRRDGYDYGVRIARFVRRTWCWRQHKPRCIILFTDDGCNKDRAFLTERRHVLSERSGDRTQIRLGLGS